MGSTYRYIGTEEENDLVREWFISQKNEPEVIESNAGFYVWFQNIGNLARSETGDIDVKNSPLVSVFPVKRIREVLLSVGEIHFLTTRTSDKFPKLVTVNRKFRNWIKSNELIFSSNPKFEGKWDYYLEGTVRNRDSDIYALPGGLQLLNQGQYFIAEDDSKGHLDMLCKTLALRGVEVPNDA